MDHRIIDEYRVADRYLDRTLPLPEQTAFESHLVDCEECRDRVLLAGMFHARNGRSLNGAAAHNHEIPIQARIVARFSMWQLVVILAIAAALLVLIPAAWFLWDLGRINGSL